MVQTPGDFDDLGPDSIFNAVEKVYGISLDGTLEPYNSYVNRVYGLRDSENNRWVVKFYRPGRWSIEAIEEEHDLIFAAFEGEIPVVPPCLDSQGFGLQLLGTIPFALFPRRSGRTFDTTNQEDLVRIGSLVGRLHRSIAPVKMGSRLICTPERSTTIFLNELKNSRVIPSELEHDFFTLAKNTSERVTEAFLDIKPRLHPIHGDMHRSNILDRMSEGLMLIDFDDSMSGPAVQDLWMLVSDRLPESWVEWELLLEGYRQFSPFDQQELELVEPLRFMRMIYYLAWQSRQRNDHRFLQDNPYWGTKAFWIQEIEDLTDQGRILGI